MAKGCAAGIAFGVVVCAVVSGVLYYYYQKDIAEARQREQQKLSGFNEQLKSWKATLKVHNSITLINDCPNGSIWVSIHYLTPPEDGRWVTQGWFEVPAGKSVPTGVVSLSSVFYFYGFGANSAWQGLGSNGRPLPNAFKGWIANRSGAPFLLAGSETPAEELKQQVWFFQQHFKGMGPQKLRFQCKS